MLQRALAVARGMGVVHSLDDLPDEWFDAAALDESQIAELRFETNGQRMEQRVLNRGR